MHGARPETPASHWCSWNFASAGGNGFATLLPLKSPSRTLFARSTNFTPRRTIYTLLSQDFCAPARSIPVSTDVVESRSSRIAILSSCLAAVVGSRISALLSQGEVMG